MVRRGRRGSVSLRSKNQRRRNSISFIPRKASLTTLTPRRSAWSLPAPSPSLPTAGTACVYCKFFPLGTTQRIFPASVRGQLPNSLPQRTRAAPHWPFRKVLTATAPSTSLATNSRSLAAAARGRSIGPKCPASIFTRIQDSHTPSQTMPTPLKNLDPHHLHPLQTHSPLCFCVREVG